VKRAAWLAVLCPLVLACGSLGPDDEHLTDLEANQARWETLGPGSYVYAVERLCFCSPESLGPVRVRVEDGVAVEHVYVDSGLAVPSAIAVGFPTVDGLFELIRSAIDADAFEVRATYDQGLGVPLDFWIDYNEMLADDELGMLVTEVVAPTP
jgi:hypothetical protein